MSDPAYPVQSANPMEQFQKPLDPMREYQAMQLMMLLGGLGPAVPGQPQPQTSQMLPLLGGPYSG